MVLQTNGQDDYFKTIFAHYWSIQFYKTSDRSICESCHHHTVSMGYPDSPLQKRQKSMKSDSLKEIQKNKGKQVESLIEETHKFLKEIQKNTSNRVKELSKTIQDLEMETNTLKKTQRETIMEAENQEREQDSQM